MGICVKVNKILTLIVIILAGLWFLLVVLLPQSMHFRLRKQINEVKADNWKYQSIAHPLHYTNLDESSLELIEIINHGIPSVFGEEAILFITNEWNKVDYTYLLYALSSLKLLGEDYRFPVYMLKQKSNHNLYNYRTILHQARTVQFIMNKCVESHNIKKLTIIAYEESALITLLALSEAEASFIFKIDKLFLINPFNPSHELFQNDPKSLARSIKRHILSDKMRTISFHYLRIILINTFRTVHPDEPDSRDYFNFVFEDANGVKYQLNSTLSISSKSMCEVNSYIDKASYFSSDYFVNLLMRVIIDDQKTKLSMQSIEYILRYRQNQDQDREVSRYSLKKCKVLYLEQLQRSKTQLKSNCYRIVQRQRYKYHQAVLLFYSSEKIELFGDTLQKIPSSNYRTSKYYTSVVTNLKDINEIVVFAKDKPINFIMTVIRSPLINPFQSAAAIDESESILSNQDTVLIQSCEGWRPIIGLHHNEHFKQLIEWKQGNCYIELEDYNSYSEWFVYNWNIVRNIIIFSLFSTHVIGVSAFNRYYSCLFINMMLLVFLLQKVYLFENMIITSTATLFELISLVLIKASQYSYVSNYYLIIVLLPLVSQIYGKLTFPFFSVSLSSCQLLWFQLLLANQSSGYLISLIKFYFMRDIYNTNQPCIYSLILLTAWQICQMPNSPLKFNSNLAQAKRKLADILFLGMLCFSLSEQGSVIHQLINFYMITHLLLGLGEGVNRIVEGNL